MSRRSCQQFRCSQGDFELDGNGVMNVSAEQGITFLIPRFANEAHCSNAIPASHRQGIVRVTLNISASISTVSHYLDARHWNSTQKHTDPFFEGWDVLQDVGSVYPRFESPMEALTGGRGSGYDVVVGRRTTKRLLAFGRRDMVLACFKESGVGSTGHRWERHAAISVDHPDYPAMGDRSNKKFTRAFQNMVIELKEVDKGTEVTCVMRVDLGGNIPRGVFRRTVGRTALMAFKAVRSRAEREEKSKKK